MGTQISNIYTEIKGVHEFAVTDKIIVKLKNELDLNQLLGQYNLNKIDKEFLGDKVFLLQLNKFDEQLTFNVANQIYESKLVEFSHPDFVIFNWTESGTNDSYFGSQWNLNKISAPSAWDITHGGDYRIAILDAGVQHNHPDISSHYVAGYDVVDHDYTADPYGNYYHGTACAGIASAVTNNGEGIAGVGYNCKIV